MQVQKLLTEEQWVAVKSIAMGTRGLRPLMSDPQFREKVGVTEHQAEELSRRLIKGRESSWRKEIVKKLLAALTPRQWEQIDQLFGNSDAGRFLLTEGPSASGYPDPEWHELEDRRSAKT